MIKSAGTAFLLLFISLSSYACDICGSGGGGSYMGLWPSFKKRFIGLRFQQNGLRDHLGPGGSITYLTTKETYRVAEVWGAVNFGQRFRVAAFVPYNFIERKNQEGTTSRNGIGDVSMVGYYRLLNHQQAVGDKLLEQNLWIGAGFKLPTGQYNKEEKNIEQAGQNTFQLGTGSMDFSAHLMYDIKFGKAGLNVNSSYKINNYNQADYRYGNKFTLNSLLYYQAVKTSKLVVSPNAGLLYETSQKDHNTRELEVFATGGHSLMGTVGTEFAAGNIGIGANYQHPLSQQLGEGKVRARDRCMVYVSYSF
ncbi:transporter [Terrimonas ferruginea]|uniref:transporter n=1 Tax=Terrimonas ferruginea TaxID=249 RepID=UPI00041ED290|nr:transporter [Terrimonas ferruginea]